MIRKVTIASFLFTSFSFFAQQIGNSDLELWDNVGSSTEEPTNWNSFKSAQGSFTSFASKQIERSTAIRTGATGQYCARVWSKSTLGVVANGNLTVGRINMGSATANDPNNYNISLTADANFSEALTASPDSLVFWVKYTAANATDSARVHAVLHDAYDLRDPIDANSTSHVVARAERNYVRTGGSWIRISVPFNYVVGSPAPNPSFILITFTTNKTPGGGTANDEVLVDDIQLVYNPVITNQQMTANDDAASTNQNTAVTISVLANDTDPENNISPSSVTITQQALNGTAVANANGTITYTPNTGFFGADNFNYQVCDGDSPITCDQANVTLVINQTLGIEEGLMHSVIAYSDGLIIKNISGKLIIYNLDGSISKIIDSSAAENLKFKTGIYFIYSNQLNSSFKILVP
jgi:hypothetical protein